ncbi:hypothetical protein CLAC_11865 [Corynebacterium lactis RW2-5]|uniref:Uncharacterized protein n=1 Tax=Corynebacterium lactis RW2-5 TaxID=1408189 RepID=A0A0K2H4U1_9CORY|nr:hypothetical protein CLAC_11865 [Corynebacterium lactis RW2-5]
MSNAGKTAPTKPKLLGFGWRAWLAEELPEAGVLSDGVGGVIGVLLVNRVNVNHWSTRLSIQQGLV